MSGLELWDQVKTPPQSALKEIKGGRLKGMSDIDPMWRYKRLTSIYGPCGTGWHYTVDKLWTEPGSDGQVFAFAQVQLVIGDNTPIVGVGGNMLIVKETKGLYCNDEAFKMSITDALGTAAKMLGVAADVYMGQMDNSKHQKTEQKASSPTVTFPEAVDMLKTKLYGLDGDNSTFQEALKAHEVEKVEDMKDREKQKAFYGDLQAYIKAKTDTK